MSRIGRKPIEIPKDVTVTMKDGNCLCERTKGELIEKCTSGYWCGSKESTNTHYAQIG